MGNTRRKDCESADFAHYHVEIHASSKNLIFTPSELVNKSATYYPSSELQNQIRLMWEYPKPGTIGIVSESVAKEIIAFGHVTINGYRLPLTCESLRNFAQSYGMSLTPEFGIRSDDLVAVACGDSRSLIFITECKGTKSVRGLSHDTEAKMIYQSGRTVRELKKELLQKKNMRFGGTIFIEVDHFLKTININVEDESAGLAEVIPDDWMYSGR
jgi:hypothetical protein